MQLARRIYKLEAIWYEWMHKILSEPFRLTLETCSHEDLRILYPVASYFAGGGLARNLSPEQIAVWNRFDASYRSEILKDKYLGSLPAQFPEFMEEAVGYYVDPVSRVRMKPPHYEV